MKDKLFMSKYWYVHAKFSSRCGKTGAQSLVKIFFVLYILEILTGKVDLRIFFQSL